jgi:hypothetical protein
VFREGGTNVLDLPGGGKGKEEAEDTYARAEYHAPLWEMVATPRIHQCAWLERYQQIHMISGEHGSEGQTRRCPNLRGPTPTKHCCGRARAKARHTFNS